MERSWIWRCPDFQGSRLARFSCMCTHYLASPSAIIPMVYKCTVLLLICSMLYSQLFARELSVERMHEFIHDERRWWQLSALPRSTLPNKVKQFVPQVFYSTSTVCWPNINTICLIILPPACKGQRSVL